MENAFIVFTTIYYNTVVYSDVLGFPLFETLHDNLEAWYILTIICYNLTDIPHVGPWSSDFFYIWKKS